MTKRSEPSEKEAFLAIARKLGWIVTHVGGSDEYMIGSNLMVGFTPNGDVHSWWLNGDDNGSGTYLSGALSALASL